MISELRAGYLTKVRPTFLGRSPSVGLGSSLIRNIILDGFFHFFLDLFSHLVFRRWLFRRFGAGGFILDVGSSPDRLLDLTDLAREERPLRLRDGFQI